MTHQFKLSVVGHASSILIYRAIGVETHAVSDAESAREAVEKLANESLGDEQNTPAYAVIFVEENFYQDLPLDLIEKFTRRPLPAVIPVPSPDSGKESFAKKRLSLIVEKAVGSDIFN
ncbi:V-type ATP synthase subunit F [bacterium]|jgi:V/A-type H+/Na+-transporting ATPase subunit F|nr:V-type ATP synthase subunit F [bacterium]MBT6831443.1 V-type ATP synthase subunit F [bacterium]MBT6996349.1 V-type ATP synthase subunit F [bacterium]MBT7772416.1 V-type ATP synthase subunit F [bacterium]